MMSEKIKLSIDKYEVKPLNNDYLSKVELWVCHNNDNKNGSWFELEDMVRNQNSILRKPLLYAMNSSGDDYLAHEIKLQAGGYIPEIGNDMRYEEKDGRIYFVVSAIVWNIYCPEVVGIFERDEFKGISMEVEVLNSKMREDGFRQIIDYNYLGVVMLGDDYETGMFDTTANVIGFQKDDFNKKVDESEDILAKVFSNVDIDKKNEGGSEMSFDRDAHAEQFKLTSNDIIKMMREQLYAVDMSEGDYYYENYCADYVYAFDYSTRNIYGIPYVINENACSLDFGAKKKMKLEYVEVEENVDASVSFATDLVEKTTEKNNEKFNKEIEDLKANVEALESDKAEYDKKVEELNSTIESKDGEIEEKNQAIFSLDEKVKAFEVQITEKDTEIESLNTFKAEKEEEAKNVEKAELYSKLSVTLDKNDIDDWKSKEADYESFEAFKKDLNEFALSKILDKVNSSKQEFNKMSVEKEIEKDSKPKSLWDSLEEKYNI